MTSSFQGFRSLIENSPDAISLIDSRGQILYASGSTAKVFGYEPEELVGRNSLDLIHLEDRVQMSRVLPELLAIPQSTLQWHARMCRKDGTCSWVESTACNLLDRPDVNAIAVNHRDISARIALEAQKKEDADLLARSYILVEEFAHAVAHDLREPLRTISAFTELLVHRMDLDDQSQKMAGYTVDAAARMSDLLDDLLLLASSGLTELPRPVELQCALAAATQNLGRAIEECGAIVTADILPLVYGNSGHLVRVFQNLISNAIKYRSKETPQIHIRAEQRGWEWVIQIVDNGIGIAPEQQERIFGMFTRLHGRNIAGAGIGLAFCRKIVEAAGGRIWVESQPGAGSTFCFTVAAAHPAAASLPPQVAFA